MFGDFVVYIFKWPTKDILHRLSYSVAFWVGISKTHLHLKWHSIFPYFISHYTPLIFLLNFFFLEASSKAAKYASCLLFLNSKREYGKYLLCSL